MFPETYLCRRLPQTLRSKIFMNIFFLVLFAFILQSCSSESGTAKTELEGTWAQCVPSTQTFDFFGNVINQTSGPSQKVTTTYQGNTVNILTETHSDANCSNLISTTGPDNDSFTIGNEFTSVNGVIVTEIDFLTNEHKTIYMLQDGGNTLYFGKQCDFTNAQCSNNRPLEINYDLPGFKVN